MIALVLFTFAPARASTQTHVPQDNNAKLTDTLATLPASSTMVLIVNDAARLRKLRAGMLLDQAVRAVSVQEQIALAWSSLATELGYSQDDLFDRLLGTRVTVVLRSAEIPPGKSPDTPTATVNADYIRWASIWRVSAQTEQRLRERLAVSPRAVVGGRTILSIEHGRYELCTRPVPNNALQMDVVIGPAGESDMFDELTTLPQSSPPPSSPSQSPAPLSPSSVPASPQPTTLGQEPCFNIIQRLADADVFFLTRVDNSHTSPTRSNWSDGAWFALGAKVTDPQGLEWTCDLIFQDPSRSERFAQLPGLDAAAFARLAEGSACMMAQADRFDALLLPELPVRSMLTRLSWPKEPLDLIGESQFVRIVTFDAEPLCLSPSNLPRPGEPLPDAKPTFAVTAGVNVTNASSLRSIFSSHIFDWIQSMEQQFRNEKLQSTNSASASSDSHSNRPVHDSALAQLARLKTSGVRVVPLNLSEPRLDRLTLGYDASFAWACEPIPPNPTSGDDAPGWFIATLGPTQGRMENDTMDAGMLTRQALSALQSSPQHTADPAQTDLQTKTADHEDSSRWLWLFNAHPRQLENALPAIIPDWRSSRSAFALIETITGKVRSVRDNLGPTRIEGTLTLRLSPDTTK